MNRIADLISRGEPSSPAIIDGARRVTYGELDAIVDETAAALRDAGLPPGARVALALGTGLDFVRYYLAASRAGLVTVPINPAYTEPERGHILTDSGARLLIAADGSHPLAGDDRTDDAVAVLLYTSGTSGRPKGAMLSDRALLANLDQLAALVPSTITAADRVFVPIPLFHIYGLTCGLGAALHAGATAVLHDVFATDASLDVMAAERVTAVVGVPSMFAAWSLHPDFARGFSAVRFAVSGSAQLSASILHRYTAAGYRLFEGYGLTEAAPAITTNWPGPSDSVAPKAGSVGRALPGIEIEIRDSDGEVVDDGDAGELFVRGPNLFDGYWPDRSDGPDADGWFRTTDIAAYDDDGELQLIGRTSDLVIVSGFNVYPAEVEAVLRAIEGIDEVAVIGIPDEQTGEAVVAYVVAAPGSRIDADEVRATAARSLARFKLPSAVITVDSLPHTITGKVMKWQIPSGPHGGS